MPHFGNRSQDRLDTCHPDIARVFNRVIEFYDCSVLEGARTLERQKELYSQGRKMFEGGEWRVVNQGEVVTHVDGVNERSAHQTTPEEPLSRAIDVVPWPTVLHQKDIWQDHFRFTLFAGQVLGIAESMHIPLIWGGDWDGDGSARNQNFHDYPHFELA